MTTFAVSTTLSGFPSSESLGSFTSLDFSAADLAWALFVTGRAPGDELLHGRASVWEFIHRASLVPAYVRVTDTGRLTRSSLALDLDRSEKVNLSYSLGQAMAGVFASQVLQVHRLLHVDRYQHHHGVTFATGRQRPDLFGQAPKGWAVIEAKGRSNAMPNDLGAKLRSQKSMVKSIAGAKPWIAAGVVAEFPPYSTGMCVQAVDPTEQEQGAQDWGVADDLFVAAYYIPFVAALNSGDERTSPLADDRLQLRQVTLGAVGVSVGLLQPIVDRITGSRERGYEGLAAQIDSILADAAAGGDGSPIRADGSFFSTTWDDALALTDYEL